MFLEGIDFNVLKKTFLGFTKINSSSTFCANHLLKATCYTQRPLFLLSLEKHYFPGVSAGVRGCPQTAPSLSESLSATTIQIARPLLTKSLNKVLLQVLLPHPLNVTSLNKTYECSHVTNMNSVVVSVCPSSEIMEFSYLFSMGYLAHLSV